MKRRVAVLVAVLSGLSGLLAVVASAPAGALADPAPVRVPLGEGTIGGMVFHEPSRRLVIAAGDAVVIVDEFGRTTATIADVPGALDPVEVGRHVVVGSPPSRQLVVIDPAAGTIVERIPLAVPGLSSLEAVGDRVWYAHGSTPADAGIGLVALTNGDPTPADLGQLEVWPGSTIGASPARPHRVYVAAPPGRSANLDWVELGGGSGSGPYRAERAPFLVAGDGSVVWSLRQGRLAAFDADTLAPTGFAFPAPPTPVDPATTLLAGHGDRRLAMASGAVVTQYDIGVERTANTTRFPGTVLAVEVTNSLLMAVVEDGPADPSTRLAPSELIVLGRDADLPSPGLSIGIYGHGLAPGDHRGSLYYRCGSERGWIAMVYGTVTEVAVPPGVTSCTLTVSGGPIPEARTFHTASSAWAGSTFNLAVGGVAGEDWVELVDRYPSVQDTPELFTAQTFLDLLGREPTPAEDETWAAELGAGTPPQELAVSLVESEEFRTRIAPLVRLYRAHFVRPPDGPGMAYWLARSREGMTVDDVSWNFGVSPEASRSGGADDSDEDFVERTYRRVLGRLSDEDGARYWNGMLATGTTRTQVITAFAESPEFDRLTRSAIPVQALFRGLVGREPSPATEARWRALHEGGRPLELLVAGLLASGEYRDRFWIDDATDGAPSAVAAPVHAGAAGPTELQLGHPDEPVQ